MELFAAQFHQFVIRFALRHPASFHLRIERKKMQTHTLWVGSTDGSCTKSTSSKGRKQKRQQHKIMIVTAQFHQFIMSSTFRHSASLHLKIDTNNTHHNRPESRLSPSSMKETHQVDGPNFIISSCVPRSATRPPLT